MKHQASDRDGLGNGLRVAVLVLLSSRAAVLLAGYLAVMVFGYPGGRPPVRDFQNEILNLPSRFDARWYLQVANSGYVYDLRAASDAQQNVVFFPAFPMAIRTTSVLFGGGLIGSILAGTLLSIAAFGAALVYLGAFVRHRSTDDHAQATLWFLAFYPFSLFYGAIYTESFFLLASVGALYHFKRGEHARAAAWGLLAGLTRPNGFLLTAPLAIQAATGTKTVKRIAAAAAPVAGMLVYSVFIWRTTGDPWMWARGHAAWGRTYQGVLAPVVDRYRMIAATGIVSYVQNLPHDALNALGALFALATVAPVARTLGAEYAMWMLLMILPPLAAGGFISAGRFSSVLFPSFVWLASVVPPAHRPGWIGVFAALQAVCAAMFYTWRPLY
jgi:hypothetical protein